MRFLGFRKYFCFWLLFSGFSFPLAAWASNPVGISRPHTVISEQAADSDLIWVLIASILIFLIPAGFTLVEVGFTRAKNAGNVVLKNLVDLAVGSIIYFVIGYGLMFGTSVFGLFGKS
jgi:hypothetical protein